MFAIVFIIFLFVIVVIVIICIPKTYSGRNENHWLDDPMNKKVKNSLLLYVNTSLKSIFAKNSSILSIFTRCINNNSNRKSDLMQLRNKLSQTKLGNSNAGRNETWRSASRTKNLEWILNNLPDNKKVTLKGPYLDIGCGDGSITASIYTNLINNNHNNEPVHNSPNDRSHTYDSNRDNPGLSRSSIYDADRSGLLPEVAYAARLERSDSGGKTDLNRSPDDRSGERSDPGGSKGREVYPVCLEHGDERPGFNTLVTRETDIKKLKSDYFNTISALMSLHHIPTIESMMIDIDRISRPGSIFVMRDHDFNYCISNFESKRDARQFLDWVHVLYNLAESDNKSDSIDWLYNMPRTDIVYQYQPMSYWDGLLSKIGFKRISKPGSKKSLICSYYAVYEKIK